MEMMTMLLETGGKVILPADSDNLAELCSSVLWKVKLASDETGYLTEISKQSVKECLGSFYL